MPINFQPINFRPIR